MMSRTARFPAGALLLALALPLGQAWAGDRTPQPCNAGNRDKVIRIALPAGDSAPPSANHQTVCYKSSDDARFELPDKIRGTLYVVFLDRTPLLDGGKPVYVIKGKQALKEKYELVGYDSSKPENNVYPYLLVDIKKAHRPTLDPLIVIEPD